MVPTAEAIAEALDSVPYGMPWTWSALRVMPSLLGDRITAIDQDEAERLGFGDLGVNPSVEVLPGVHTTVAVEVDVVRIHVKQAELDAWDKTIEDVLRVALGNLRREVGTWDAGLYEDEYQGLPVRLLRGWPSWSSSLVADAELLMHCFGSSDQLFVAPYACNLISLPVEVDRDIAADLVDMFGLINPRSLLMGLPAFVLRDRVLTVEALPGFEDLGAEPWNDFEMGGRALRLSSGA